MIDLPMVDTPGGVLQPVGSFNDASQEDFPVLLPEADGALVVYVDYDDEEDVVMARRWRGENRFDQPRRISEPGSCKRIKKSI